MFPIEINVLIFKKNKRDEKIRVSKIYFRSQNKTKQNKIKNEKNGVIEIYFLM
jgi:hypothetical protein